MKIIDITPIHSRIRKNLEAFLNGYTETHGQPAVALIKVGNDPASESYFRSKAKMCQRLGIKVEIHNLNSDVTAGELSSLLGDLSQRNDVDGIMVENKLPEDISYAVIMDSVSPWKDLDGASSTNLGLTEKGLPALEPATARAVLETLNFAGVRPGTKVCLINRSITVGRPLAMMLLNNNFTPIICHSKTSDLQLECRSSPVIVSAVGKPAFLNSNFVSKGCTVIDVGINVEKGKIVGDVDTIDLQDLDVNVTPVPGGIGKLTSILVFDNLRISLQRKAQ